jgi:predicted dithiol-disulfide oxidoreductase (DUF899 family)
MTNHKVGSREEWLAARTVLLEREKEHTHRGDELARERRELPWVRIEKEYSFDSDEGTKTLDELFDGRSQLLVYHFMFGPEYEAVPAGGAGHERVCPGRWRRLPHLLGLRPRPRRPLGRLSVARPRTPGTQ